MYFLKFYKMANMEEQLKILLEELNETKKQSAYSENHLLNTIIQRVEELILNKIESEIVIGF